MELSDFLKKKRKQTFKSKTIGDYVYYVNRKIKDRPIEKNLTILDIADHWIICEINPGQRAYFDMENGAERATSTEDYVTGVIWPSKQYMKDEYQYCDEIYRLRAELPFDKPEVITKLIKILENPIESEVIIRNLAEPGKRRERSRKKQYCISVINKTKNTKAFLSGCEINEDVYLDYTKLREDAAQFDFKEAIYVRKLLTQRKKEIWKDDKIWLDVVDYKTGDVYDPNKNNRK